MQVEAGDAHFAQDAPDTEWLPVVGQRGWVLLTKDKKIRSNALERSAPQQGTIAAFMLGGRRLVQEAQSAEVSVGPSQKS